jgi:hypothetical protein
MVERRTSQRGKTYKVARIAFGGNRAVIGCLVRNLSETGACLAVESPIGIPETFNLVFDSGEASRNCHVMWRTAGVSAWRSRNDPHRPRAMTNMQDRNPDGHHRAAVMPD